MVIKNLKPLSERLETSEKQTSLEIAFLRATGEIDAQLDVCKESLKAYNLAVKATGDNYSASAIISARKSHNLNYKRLEELREFVKQDFTGFEETPMGLIE